MDQDEQNQTKQNIFVVKDLIKRFDSTNKQEIEKQLQTHEWIRIFMEDRLQVNETSYYTFRKKFKKSRVRKERSNITVRKRKILQLQKKD